MRTRVRIDPDGPRQVVAGSGGIRLEIVDVAEHDDPGVVAELVRQRYWDDEYDAAADWPVRMAVIRQFGVPTHRVWVMCHLVTDGVGVSIILGELADRALIGSGACGTDGMPPPEQARWQRSPAGQRQNERTLRHWERLFRTIPARRLPESGDRPRPRYWNGGFTSRTMHLAVHAISARTGAAASPVLLALFAVALARVTGISPVVALVVVSKRFRPGLSGTVARSSTTVCVCSMSPVSPSTRRSRKRSGEP